MEQRRPPGRRGAKRLGVGESPEPYEEEAVDECVKELSVRTTQEKDKEEEDERLHLVLGKLFALRIK